MLASRNAQPGRDRCEDLPLAHTLRPIGSIRHEGGKKMDRVTWLRMEALIVVAMVLSVCGCTCPDAYIRNCFKVGPNPCVPAGATAPNWIDEGDVRVREDCAQVEQWWTVFQDPALDQMIVNAYSQNLSLREGGLPDTGSEGAA